jgi:hypothetical protein
VDETSGASETSGLAKPAGVGEGSGVVETSGAGGVGKPLERAKPPLSFAAIHAAFILFGVYENSLHTPDFMPQTAPLRQAIAREGVP